MGGGPGFGTGTAVDKNLRRFFVRGLPWETTGYVPITVNHQPPTVARLLAWALCSDLLRRHFEPLGEVEDVAVVKDPGTGKSKGYGFVTMRWLEGAQRVAAAPPARIGDRDVITVLAAAKDGVTVPGAPPPGQGGGGGPGAGAGMPPAAAAANPYATSMDAASQVCTLRISPAYDGNKLCAAGGNASMACFICSRGRLRAEHDGIRWTVPASIEIDAVWHVEVPQFPLPAFLKAPAAAVKC
jgi:heterogeneous nuclear ribonucleoprotein A1/A3